MAEAVRFNGSSVFLCCFAIGRPTEAPDTFTDQGQGIVVIE